MASSNRVTTANSSQCDWTSDSQISTSTNGTYRVSKLKKHFHEVKRIGEGGFGSVFQARHKLDEVYYAVKKVSLNSKDHSKLLREVRVLATLNHPSVVRYITSWREPDTEWATEEGNHFKETGSRSEPPSIAEDLNKNQTNEDGRQYEETGYDSVSPSGATDLNNKCAIVRSAEDGYNSESSSGTTNVFYKLNLVLCIQMELCHCNLDHWLKERNRNLFKHCQEPEVYKLVNESENMSYIRQLLKGLEYIHSKDIIHRDIKPLNIFLQADVLKIGDFGLARDIEVATHPTTDPSSTGGRGLTQGVGTPPYISPEQQNGTDYGKETDIFSVGIIVFELYCPFREFLQEKQGLIKELKSNCFPSDLLKSWPKQMKLVGLMVDPDPNNRPSAEDLLRSDKFGETCSDSEKIAQLEALIRELETKNRSLVEERSNLKVSH